MQKHLLFFLIFLGYFSQAQELNCTVTVSADQISGSNKQIFKTLEKAVTDFMNTTRWTEKVYEKQERIQCALHINITEKNNNQFKGTIQVQSVRPIYNSTYQSPLLTYQDANVDFTYEEFQTLLFNETSFESNLTSLLSFYAYIILGFDVDSFSLKGGQDYFKKAENLLLTAQQGGAIGWSAMDGNKSRYQLINDLLNDSYAAFREMLYNYHLKGLDTMSKDKKKAKEVISKSIISLQSIYSRKANAFVLRIFADTKAEEIESIFKDGPMMNTSALKAMLLRVYPAKSANWNAIK